MPNPSRRSKIPCFLLFLLPVLVIIYSLYGVSRRMTDPHPIIRSTAQARATARAAGFSGQVLLSTEVDGQRDVVLWNGSRYGGINVPVAASKADETDPVWSPDGRWIAYLSDESGKVELYARMYPGLETVRLTHAEDIQWEGPLLWLFMDGAPLVLAGTRPDGLRQLYQIPTAGADRTPRALDGTDGARAPRFFVHYPSNYFSHFPDAPMLFFDRMDGHLLFYSLASKRSQLVTQEDGPRGMEAAPGAVMPGWSNLMVYLTRGDPPEGEVGMELRSSAYGPIYGLTPTSVTVQPAAAAVETPIPPWLTPEGPSDNRLILSSRPGVIAGFLTNGYSLLVAQDGPLDGSGASGCYRWHPYNASEFPLRKDRPALFPDVCVDSPANGFNIDMTVPIPLDYYRYPARWVVFSGRPAEGGPPGLYAAYIFTNPALIGESIVTRLSGTPSGKIVPGSLSVFDSNANRGYFYYFYGPTPVVDPR